MGFLSFYLIALIPVVVCVVLWVLHREMHVFEALGGCLAGFAVAGIMHAAAVKSMTADTEVWSGEVLSVRFRPEWRERYTEHHSETTTHTNSDGSTYTTTRHWTTTEYMTHPDAWYAETNIHEYELDISLSKYRAVGNLFGGESVARPGKRRTGKDDSTMVRGDPNDYFVFNRTRAVEPVIRGVSFENRIQASPSVFSYKKLSEERSKVLPDYPEVHDSWRSRRVYKAPVNIRRWDEMMAKLGPEKKVNVILARLETSADAQDLEAKWIGGKKNDLVLCYGDGWSYVFGWTERDRVKRELETLLLGEVDDTIIPEIDRIVREHYELVDWDKFDYLSIEPRPVHYWILIGIMALTQAGLHFWFLNNEYSE